MSLQRWYYFLSIERDFGRTLEFVELAPANAGTFSDAYVKLLLLIGSEVDVVAKMLCDKSAPGNGAKNIVDYRAILTGRFQGFHTVAIDIPRYNATREPWKSWGGSSPTSPVWWTAYNSVKHRRDTAFPDASQENVLDGLCGLLVLLLYLYKDVPHLQPYPELLNYGFPAHLVTEGGKKLPGT